MVRFKHAFGAAALAALATVLSLPALAKPADCYTTDEGNYPCDFRGIDKAGSFLLQADGYPAVTVEIESPGVAWVFKEFGIRNVPMPGPYYRASDDRACWDNPDTGDRVCAW